jgi:hypothetical protein
MNDLAPAYYTGSRNIRVLVNDNYSCPQCQLKPSVTPVYFFMFYCFINFPLPSAHAFGGA